MTNELCNQIGSNVVLDGHFTRELTVQYKTKFWNSLLIEQYTSFCYTLLFSLMINTIMLVICNVIMLIYINNLALFFVLSF